MSPECVRVWGWGDGWHSDLEEEFVDDRAGRCGRGGRTVLGGGGGGRWHLTHRQLHVKDGGTLLEHIIVRSVLHCDNRLTDRARCV
jgi:hypothetical protein